MADKFVVLVEGPDDYHVLQHLLTVRGVNQQISYRLEGRPTASLTPEEIVFKAPGGINKVLENLKIQVKIVGETKRLGVIVDADLDLVARWQSLRDILVNAGYQDVPVQPSAQGTIVEHGEKPRIGVWIMPNNTLPGKIEDFITLLVPTADNLWKRAELNVQQIPLTERLFTENAFIKAHVHTWLAWQERPGLPMGKAISEHYLDANVQNARQLVAWLRRLFDLGEA